MRNKFKHIVYFILLFSLGTSFAQSKKCSYCGDPIKEKYVVSAGKEYHEYCYVNFVQPRCAYCNNPLDGSYIIKNGKNYHEKCYTENIALRCDLCGDVINGLYSTDYWGNNYHKYHKKDTWVCNYCGRYISPSLTGGGFEYNDGRNICRICYSSAVTSLSKAESIVGRVKEVLRTFGININFDKIDIKLVDKDHLRSLSFENNHPSDTRGFAHQQYWTLNGEIKKREFTIYLLNGMPQKDFEAVAAHELMHVWQYLNSPDNLALQFSEGSAEYAAYLYLSRSKDEYSNYLIHQIKSNRNMTYGGGFNRVKEMVDNSSISHWLEILNKQKNFPHGY